MMRMKMEVKQETTGRRPGEAEGGRRPTGDSPGRGGESIWRAREASRWMPPGRFPEGVEACTEKEAGGQSWVRLHLS